MLSTIHTKNKPSAVATLRRESVDKPSAFGSLTMENLQEEVWKDVVDFEGFYRVSNLGRVMSIKFNKEKILKPSLERYYKIVLKNKGLKKTAKVHRLVAIAFIPNPENKPQVNHINGIKTDNRLTNLEWVTSSENCIHAMVTKLYVNKGCKNKYGENHPASKITNDTVLRIRELKSSLSVSEIASMFGLKYKNVYSILSRTTWKHI